MVDQATTAALTDRGTAQLQSVAQTDLRTTMHNLTVEQQAALASTSSVDDDADGLTNTQEQWWCTDPLNPDSDGDGASDGDEVAALKAWLGNETSGPSATGKPFVGWPPDHDGCYDDDMDAIPDLAERWELGLNMNRESTDRDKFDDGQELFGNTYCPSSGDQCGYGALPRDGDWGIIFAEMPSWVESPGDHPLVAAFPIPEIDIQESSLHMETVTIVTTDHTISEGEEQSYSTAKTEGASTSVADTVTWNDWQEVSVATPIEQNSLMSNVSAEADWWKMTGRTVEAFGMTGAGAALGLCFVPGIGWGTCLGGAAFLGSVGVAGIGMDLVGEKLDARSDQGPTDQSQIQSYCPDMSCISLASVHPPTSQEHTEIYALANNMRDRGSTGGTQYSIDEQSRLTAQSVYRASYPIFQPVPITVSRYGSSQGGSQTTIHEQYEEHTVTNGEAFSSEESWGTATAVDSAHAADLWFTYQVRNTGMEYAQQICDLAFNVYIGDDPNAAYTYFVGDDLGGDGCFNTFMPGEEHEYTAHRIPLTLEQMKAIDLGGPVRVVVEDYTYGIDELFYEDAVNANVQLAMEDGTADGDEDIDHYLIPTWGEETVLDVMARYFPHETDADGNLIAVWTPEQRIDTPAWCNEPRQVGDTLWCQHALSTADWWNVYTDGLGDGTEGFQDTPAAPGSTALFRFNKDTDLDGYSDRSEVRFGTDPDDAASHPEPELLGGVHSIRDGDAVTATLSLLNTGLYDAYGVESVMIAPNDSISITNNTVGGSGRVRALKDVVVGSRILQPAYSAATWQGTAQPFSAGYYTGAQDRVYTFTALDSGEVSTATLRLDWDDGSGANGTLDVGDGYASPTPLDVGSHGVQVGLVSGEIQAGDTFTVAARTPRDTFQYAIQQEPYTEPVVLVSYNDPQGNHRFVTPVIMTHPTEDLLAHSGQMLENLGAEIVTQQPITTTGAYTTSVVTNWPADVTLENAHLFLEFVNITGTVASEIPVTATIEPGPTVVPIQWSTDTFSPTFQPDEDYIVMAFWTDWQGNIIDTAARPLSSFQTDPQPTFAMAEADATWDFGTAAQGTMLRRDFTFANTGQRDLLTYVSAPTGISVSQLGSQHVGPADVTTYDIHLNTVDLPVGTYNETITIRTSDPEHPIRMVQVTGTITEAVPDTDPGSTQRPLDWDAYISGDHSQGEWVEFTHNLGPDPQTLHPVKVYGQDYDTFWGVGKYATDFGEGTASYAMFGNGSDSNLVVNTGQTVYVDDTRTTINGTATVGQSSVPVESTLGFNVGDEVLIIQVVGTGAGNYDVARITSISADHITLDKPLANSYSGFVPTVTLYDGTNYTGNSETFHTHDICLTNNPMGHDVASSISVSSGSIATLFADCNYGNDYTTFTSSDSDLGNNPIGSNRASSIRVSSSNAVHSQVLRIPNYRNVTVQNGGYLRAHGWDGFTGGILFFRVSGMLQVDGQVVVDGGGYRGGTRGHFSYVPGRAQGWQGEFYSGEGTTSRNANGGSGGGGQGDDKSRNMGAGGGGGSYGSPGSNGQPAGNPTSYGGMAGDVYGTPVISSQMYFGSGGGGGGSDDNNSFPGGNGGSGGGLAVIAARMVEISGSVTSNGGTGGSGNAGGRTGGGGGGAGGSILLQADSLVLGSGRVQALGGSGGSGMNSGGAGGAGGVGRIRIEYCASLSGSTNPSASTQKLDCYMVEQIESSPYESARLNLPESFTNGRHYWIQYGRRHVFSGAGEWQTTLRVPATAFTDATLDALISDIGSGNLTLRLDIGNDGTWDWETSQSVDNAGTLNSPDLSAAFNAYWAAQGGPLTDTLDVPVKVYLSKAGQVLLTNLQMTPTGSKMRHVRLTAQDYADVTLDLTIGESGSGAFTVAADVGDDGTVDWTHSGSDAYPVQLTTADLSTAFNAYLAGHSGAVDVPIRFYVAPFVTLNLDDFSATPSASVDVTVSETDVTFGVTNPTEGETVPITATLHNLGTGNSGGLSAAFYAEAPDWGDWYIGSAYVPQVPAGGTAQATIDWDTLGFTGTVPVRVVVDPYGRLNETDETNNKANSAWEILTRPDLLITDLALSDGEPMVGETVTATLTLANRGQSDATLQTTRLETTNLTETVEIPSLSGGLTTTIDIPWTPTAPGPYQLLAQADQDNVIDEYDEGNNETWRDRYVGFSSPLLLNSGTGSDPVYTAESGYGYVDTGAADVTSICGSGTEPYETLRRDPDGQIAYRFDHLLPGHFYHLDVTLYECDGAGRQESIYVDGTLIAGPEDLGDGEMHRLSLRLDPALYADHRVDVTVDAPGIDGAVVSEVNLYDVDYRYADAGGGNDPAYPASDVELEYGWLDGVDNTGWGTLPYQSVRVDQSDDELRYRFDGLDADKTYNVHLSFWQPSGTARIQRVRIDGLDTGLTVDTGDYQQHNETIAVPTTAYADDGSIVVSIARINASTGAMVNEIALEEETLPLGVGCDVQETPYFTEVYGAVQIAEEAAPAGSVIQAFSPRGETVGCFVADEAGQYGLMRIYGADTSANPPIPGMQDGELVAFRVNGAPAVAEPLLYWQDDHAAHQVDLNTGAIEGQSILLSPGWNLMSFFVDPPVPSVAQVLSVIDERYDRVLGEGGVYATEIPPQYNTLQELYPGLGYYVRITQTASVNALIEGLREPVTTPLALHTGWNWIGYLPEATLPITEALQSIDGQYQRVLSIDKTYDPALPEYSTLQEMTPGQGYLIHMDSATTLTYPAPVDGQTLLEPTGMKTACDHVMPTPHISLLYGSLILNDQPAPVGTRIEVVTPRGNVAGCYVVESPGRIAFTHLYGEDATANPPIPGFREGEPVSIQINGIPIETETLTWQADRAPHAVELEATLESLYLPLIVRGQ
jgi:hypothetical protein